MSSAAKEVELKLVVPSEADLVRLEADLGAAPTGVVHQENVYFDADGRLAAARWSLRLRKEEGRNLLSLKGPKTSGDGVLVSRPETPDVAVSDEIAADILAGDADPLLHLAAGLEGTPDAAYVGAVREVLHGARVARTGGIDNERRPYPVEVAGLALTVEVDRTDYGRHGRFFEVELEIPATATAEQAEAVQRWLEGRFEALGLPVEAAPGKVARLRSFVGA